MVTDEDLESITSSHADRRQVVKRCQTPVEEVNCSSRLTIHCAPILLLHHASLPLVPRYRNGTETQTMRYHYASLFRVHLTRSQAAGVSRSKFSPR